VAAELGDEGVPSVRDCHRERHATSVINAFRHVMNAELVDLCASKPLSQTQEKRLRERIARELGAFLGVAACKAGVTDVRDRVLERVADELTLIRDLEKTLAQAPLSDEARQYLLDGIPAPPEERCAFQRRAAAWVLTHRLGALTETGDFDALSAHWLDEWLLRKAVAETFEELTDDHTQPADAHLVQFLCRFGRLLDYSPGPERSHLLRSLFDGKQAAELLGLNRFDGIIWLNEERFSAFAYWLFFVTVVSLASEKKLTQRCIAIRFARLQSFLAAATDAGFRSDHFLETLAQ
jgi:hypothetical protein